MNFRKRFKILTAHQKGQTSIEYILMVAAIVTMLSGVLNIARRYMIEGDDSFMARLTDPDRYFDASYRTFYLRR